MPYQLRKDIESAIKRHSAENASNTPDFILAEFLMDCLKAFDAATRERERWYGRETAPSTPLSAPEPTNTRPATIDEGSRKPW